MSVQYRYLKATPIGQPSTQNKRLTFLWRGLSLAVLVIGLAFIGNAALPILYYELTSSRFTHHLASPLSSQGIILGEEAAPDYTNPKIWFPAAPILPPLPSRITHYTLSIPKLKIEEATVQIGGEDLMASLIHYPGTALPGQYGNSVIFGHSVLPQFFNPRDYKTIFSTLPKLEKGDEVWVDYDGIRYRYLVRNIVETSADDVTVLQQNYDNRWISLVTCVPPGTYLKRLIVQAQLVAI